MRSPGGFSTPLINKERNIQEPTCQISPRQLQPSTWSFALSSIWLCCYFCSPCALHRLLPVFSSPATLFTHLIFVCLDSSVGIKAGFALQPAPDCACGFQISRQSFCSPARFVFNLRIFEFLLFLIVLGKINLGCGCLILLHLFSFWLMDVAEDLLKLLNTWDLFCNACVWVFLSWTLNTIAATRLTTRPSAPFPTNLLWWMFDA